VLGLEGVDPIEEPGVEPVLGRADRGDRELADQLRVIEGSWRATPPPTL
jgi:hypothetical protein